jgi:nucleoid-associated protein YgaU
MHWIPAMKLGRKLVLAVLAPALMAGGCSGGAGGRPALPDGPNWSLADKPPVALGGAGAEPEAGPASSPYQYKGGRDPVTGQAPVIGPVGAESKTGKAAGGATSNAGGPRTVVIQKGDTLHGLSLQHHVSVKALMAANKMSSTTIIPGQKIVIPTS